MKISSLKCNHCGANLDINPNIKFFNCNHCGSSLMIKKSADVIYTEVLDEIKENTETLKENSSDLLIEQKIERLDRDWLRIREKYKVRNGKRGYIYPDDPNSGTNAGIIMSLMFLFVATGMFLFYSYSTNPTRSMKPSLTVNGQPIHPNSSLYKDFHRNQKEPVRPFSVIFIGLVIIIVGANIVNIIAYKAKSERYFDAKRRYLRQRNKLLEKLE